MTELAARRLLQQGLVASEFASAASVVTWLGVVQAQDYPAALWAVGLRLPGATAGTIEQALRDRQIIRTWLNRGTLHFASAADIRWMLDLFAPGVLAGHARRNRQLGLDEATLKRSSALLQEAVRGEPKTRRELFALLDAHGLASANQRGIYMLARASYEGLIAQGVQLGRDPVFFAPDEVLPKSQHLERAEALAELTQRYFTSHGPATLQDFVWWSGLKVSDARAGLDAVRAELALETVEGHEYWSAPVSATSVQPQSVAFLLPAYDEYLIGYQDRSASLAPEYAARVKNANGLGATVVYDGRVIGTWTREAKRARVTIHAAPFAPWSDAMREAVEAAVASYGEFIGQPTQLDAGT
jgi:hypothetical protein